MQWESRINITVTSPEVWKRFEVAYDLGLGLDTLANKWVYSFICDDEMGFLATGKYDLFEKVSILAETLGQDGIVIADGTSSSADPVEEYAYYFGASVVSGSFECERSNKYNMYRDTSINNVRSWIKYGDFILEPKEKQQIDRCLGK